MDDLLQEFINEAHEGLEQLDNNLIALEKDPYNQELLHNIFRVMHTIKGTCGFLKLAKLEKVAHACEEVLGKIRDGKININADIITTVLDTIFTVKMILDHIEQHGMEPKEEYQNLIDKLLSFSRPENIATQKESSKGEKIEKKISQKKSNKKEKRQDETTLEMKEKSGAEVLPTKRAHETIRVNLDTLEDLMNMVSELVLTRNQLLQLIRKEIKSDLLLPVQKLNHVTTDLQEIVMKTRMQPIEGAWIGLPKLIRTLNQELGKKINLQMDGKETELDRQVVELIKDPLTHMIRNAADHGIESPQERLDKGKSETGTIYLSAFHVGGQIIIEVKDDGKGIDPVVIKRKAVEKGVVSLEKAEELTQNKLFDLIFTPGFSTSESINTISGRGVGMDVVKSNIEKIGGSVDVNSKKEIGTTFTIKIPLTLAILPALIIRSGKQRFALPHLSVTEIVRNIPNTSHKIEYMRGGSFLRLRGEIYPLVDLKNILQFKKEDFFDCVETHQTESEGMTEKGQEDTCSQYEPFIKSARNFIVVLQVGKLKFGLIVDEVFQTQEVVIKPLSRFLKNIKIFSGSTIMGDGTVVMILDPLGITASINHKIKFDNSEEEHNDNKEIKKHYSFRYICFLAGDETLKAIPVSLISRIEELNTDRIERCDGKYMVQYRDSLMPLIPYGKRSLDNLIDETVNVLTFFDGHKYAGLLIDKVIDIVNGDADLSFETRSTNIHGSIVLNGKVAELLNVDAFFRKHIPSWQKKSSMGKQLLQGKTIIYVEPNSFYSTITQLIFECEKVNIIHYTDPKSALKGLKNGSPLSRAFVSLDEEDTSSLLILLKCLKEKEIPIIGLTSNITDLNDVIGKEFLTALLHKMNNLEIGRFTREEFGAHRENVA